MNTMLNLSNNLFDIALLGMNPLQEEISDLINFDESLSGFIRETALDGLSHWDIQHPENDWMNQKFWNSLGYDPEVVSRDSISWEKLIHPEDHKVLMASIKNHLQDPVYPFNMIVRYQHKNGSTVWFRCHGKAIKDDGGNPIGVLGAHIDITRFIVREHELSIAESQFRGAFEHSALGMALVSTEGKWLKVNKKLCSIVGYSEEELLLKTFQDITHPDDLDADLSQVNLLLEDKISGYEMEKRYFHRDGHTVWVLLNVSLVRDANKNPVHFVSQILDITHRKKTEEELRQVTDRLSLALKGSRIGTWEFDVVNNKLIWDDGMFKIYGISQDKFTHAYDAWRNSLHPDDLEQGEKDVQLALEGKKEFNTEFRIVWPDDSIHYIKGLALVQRDVEGNPLRMLGTNWDITEEKKTEEIYRMMAANESKRKEMEQFAYITSHDLREPLVTIQKYLDGFIEDYGQDIDADARHYIEASIRASNHMQELIVGLLDYSRLSKEKKISEVDSKDILSSVIEDLHALIDTTQAKIKYGHLPVLHAFPLELKLLFQNLIQNAIKFRKPDVVPEVQIDTKKITGGWQFSFKDNGIGIREKDFEKVFTLFRRLHNKTEYEGSGIGLAYAKKIVEIHHGKIWLVSSPNEGSTFYFSILTETL